MKVLVSGFSSGMHCKMILGLAERSFDIVYWVAKKRVKDFISDNRSYFANTIFHDYTDALSGISASGLNTESFEPIGVDILEKLEKYEPQLLSLMNRIDFGDTTFPERHHRYYQYVWYWRGVLSSLKPDLVLFHDVPHIVFDTTLCYVAKMMGIKTIFKRQLTSMRDHVAFVGDFFENIEVNEEYEKLKKNITSISNVREDVIEIYEDLLKMNSKNVPFKYAAYSGISGKEKAVEVFPQFSRILKNIKQFNFFKTTVNFLRLLFKRQELCSITKKSPLGMVLRWKNIFYGRIRRQFKKEYESLHNTYPDLSVSYVYFPLNRQPEATTNPMGGVFDDQILAADLLAGALPKGWKLYIKEHPHQWTLPLDHTGRYRGYYRTLKRHKNVELISVDISGFDLISNAKAVATIAGSTAVEAVVKGKPAIVFGYPMYAMCDGVFSVNTFQSCKDALQIIERGCVPDKLKVLIFFQALTNISVGAFIHKRHSVGSKYSYEESLRNLTEGLLNACIKLGTRT